MTPNVAALICSVCILTIFVIDFKRKPDVTINHWIPFLWLLIVSSRPVTQWFNLYPLDESYEMIDAISKGNVIDATIFSILMILGMIILSRRIKECNQILKNNRWLFILIFYCGISVLWSDYSFVSFKRWFRGIGTFLMVLVVLTETDPLETLKTMLRRCAFLMVPLSILFIKYFRNLGVYYGEYGGTGYCGVTTHKNILGRLCLILGIYFIWEILIIWKNKNKNKSYLYGKDFIVNITFLMMILWLLLKSNSKTSISCFAIAICILLFFNVNIIRSNISYINRIILLFVVTFFILDLTIDLTHMLVTSLGRDMTFTGRTELWSFCLNFVDNPIIGVGYDSFWLGERLKLFWTKYWWHPIQAHNGYIDVYLQIGIIGIFLLAGTMFSVYKNIKKTIVNDFQLGIFQLSFYFQFLLYNITENAFKLQSFFWFVFLLIVLNYRQVVSPKIR